jgi:hypothetical protein
MLHQNVKAQGFRELSEYELQLVAGGLDTSFEPDIEVWAWRESSGYGGYSNSFDFSDHGGSGGGIGSMDWEALFGNATPAPPPQQPPGAAPADADKNGTVSINEAKEYNRLHPGSNTQPSQVCDVAMTLEADGAALLGVASVTFWRNPVQAAELAAAAGLFDATAYFTNALGGCN